MPRDSRSYRHRSSSRSKSRSPARRRGSPDRTRNRDRIRAKRSRSREKRRVLPLHRRDRKRSRSKEKDRSKRLKPSRPKLLTKGLRRSRSRGRDKKSRSGSPDRKRVKSKSPVHKEGVLTVKDEPLDKEAEQKRLELEMQKRRERIEQWREKRKPKLELPAINIAPPSRKWTLEDEDEDDEENADDQAKENGTEPEVDPLDAYMKSVTDEVKHTKEKEQKSNAGETPTVTTEVPAANGGKGKVTIITAVAKKTTAEPAVQKGELMESNADALEYSSEEEQEDLDDAMTRLAKKKKVPTATLR